MLGYHPTACFQTPDYIFALDTKTTEFCRIPIDGNGKRHQNIIWKDIFVLNMNNLNNVISEGYGNFYSSSDYACDKNAKFEDPACSKKYLEKILN